MVRKLNDHENCVLIKKSETCSKWGGLTYC